MKKNNFQMAIEIKTHKGPVLKPFEVHFWDLNSKAKPKHLHNMAPHTPFKFYTDAILALCYHKMTDYKSLTSEQKHFSEKAYRSFDPYTELFQKSAPRIKSLRNKDLTQQIHFENFEKKMTDAWESIFQDNTIHLNKLNSVLNHISEFEKNISAPLIYNFSVHFSQKFTEKLLCFYSFLFHLRSVIAVDFNAHVEDTSYECVRCDSISDYLPKSDYTVNDALLYWDFKKLSTPFVGHKDKDVRLEKLLIEPLDRHFKHYSHNATNLINQLPTSYLNSKNPAELEEALHQIQMDWLLGSESGILFKLREEVFGVLDGYDQIFWPEASHTKVKKASALNLCFVISEKDLSKDQAVA